MLFTKSEIESLIEEETRKYFIEHLLNEAVPVRLPDDNEKYYILAADWGSYDSYKLSDRSLVDSGATDKVGDVRIAALKKGHREPEASRRRRLGRSRTAPPEEEEEGGIGHAIGVGAAGLAARGMRAREQARRAGERVKGQLGLGPEEPEPEEPEPEPEEPEPEEPESETLEGIIYAPNLPDNVKRGETTVVTECTEKDCAQWVSNTLQTFGGSTGNAWHQHRNTSIGRGGHTSFKEFGEDRMAEAAEIFRLINKKPRNYGAYNARIRKLAETFLEPAGTWEKRLKLGDIVGLYWANSAYFGQAFFESTTGYKGLGSTPCTDEGGRCGDGPFFLHPNGNPWVQEDLGEDIKFKPGNTLKTGRGFGMNTHLGFVGAMYKGTPIIFHQVGQIVKAVPLNSSRFGRGGQLGIFWNKRSDRTLTERKELQENIFPDIHRSSLPINIKKALVGVKTVKKKIMSSLKIDEPTLALLTNAAIGVSGRESTFEKGKTYRLTNWAETIASYILTDPRIERLASSAAEEIGGTKIPFTNKRIPKDIDPSIGATQIKYQAHFGEEGQLHQYAKDLGITSPLQLAEYSKSIIAAIGVLSLLYKRAINAGYSTHQPGTSRKQFTSTGNAALDLSLVGYQKGPSVIAP